MINVTNQVFQPRGVVLASPCGHEDDRPVGISNGSDEEHVSERVTRPRKRRQAGSGPSGSDSPQRPIRKAQKKNPSAQHTGKALGDVIECPWREVKGVNSPETFPGRCQLGTHPKQKRALRQLAMHLADMAGLIIGADAPEQTAQQKHSPQFIHVSAHVASIITIPTCGVSVELRAILAYPDGTMDSWYHD